jgi:hypothetical protein
MVERCQPKNGTDLHVSGGLCRFSKLFCFCTAMVTHSAKATRHDFSLIQPNSRTGESFTPFSRAPPAVVSWAPTILTVGGCNQHPFIMMSNLSEPTPTDYRQATYTRSTKTREDRKTPSSYAKGVLGGRFSVDGATPWLCSDQ